MKIESNLIIEKNDLDYMLSRYLRSYLFYHKNKAPEAVEIPMIPAIKNGFSKEGEMIPVKFTEFKPEIVAPQEVLELPAEEEVVEEVPKPKKAKKES